MYQGLAFLPCKERVVGSIPTWSTKKTFTGCWGVWLPRLLWEQENSQVRILPSRDNQINLPPRGDYRKQVMLAKN